MRKGSEVVAVRILLALVLAPALGCSPRLGDSCDVSTDCSVQADRDCDLSAPGGYCTIEDCIEGDCLGEGYCVRFEPDESRLSSSWCMAKCGRGCRDRYRCVSASDLNDERCGESPKKTKEWRKKYAGKRDQLEADVEKYQMAVREWQETGGKKPKKTPAVKLAELEVCLAALPRAAEVIDSKSDARFCVQGESESEPERMSTAP